MTHPRLRWLPRAAQREQPWTNGGGRTREVAIAPAGATLAAGCRWRVSCAEVASDGPFSVLPGMDRSLWLLAGAGCELELGDQTVRLDRRWQRVDFAGERQVAARLLDGPVQDLNVMVERASTRVAAALLHLAPGTGLQLPGDGEEQLLLLLAGGAAVHGGWLEPGDAVLWTGTTPVLVGAGLVPSVLLLASFAPR
ncbi:MAG: HutD family protein [Planctomycetes bacterium]|nr:HutD family protein [Planctomycetota bacterium]